MCRRREVYTYYPLLSSKVKTGYKWTVLMVSFIFWPLNVVMWGYLVDQMKSTYYTWFFFPPVVLQLLGYIFLLAFHGYWTEKEFELYAHLTFCDLCACCRCSGPAMMRFISLKFFIFVYVAIMWQKPLWGYNDKFASPTNASSCTTDFTGTTTEQVYNPDGIFDINLPYQDPVIKKFCTMDVTYAWPNLNTSIQGYVQSPLSSYYTGLCSAENKLPIISNTRINGYVDTYICSGSYPSPVLGVVPPVTEGSYAMNIMYCPGNNPGVVVCIDPNGHVYYPKTEEEGCPGSYRAGVPKKICTACLSWYRYISGDINGPEGYEHCEEYNINNPPPLNLVCNLCSGRGFGWNPDERYDNESMVNALVYSTIMFGSHILEYVLLDLSLRCVRWYYEFKPTDEKSN